MLRGVLGMTGWEVEMERVLRLVLNQSDFENSVPTMKIGMFSISISFIRMSL